MRFKKENCGSPKRQTGAALFMALMFLLVLTILGIFGMSNARLENLMAGNHQFQTTALNDAETILASAEFNLESMAFIPDPANSGDCIYYSLDNTAIPDLPYTWPGEVCQYPSGALKVAGDPVESYVIEWLGLGEPSPTRKCSATTGTGNAPPGCTVNVYRITAENTAGRGARRILQEFYETNNGP